MKVKRTFAPDIRQAMRRVREEQGADAVILGNRKVDGGVEIISAVDYDEDVFYQAIESSADSKRVAGESPRSTRRYTDVAAALATPLTPSREAPQTQAPAHEHVLMRERTPRKTAASKTATASVARKSAAPKRRQAAPRPVPHGAAAAPLNPRPPAAPPSDEPGLLHDGGAAAHGTARRSAPAEGDLLADRRAPAPAPGPVVAQSADIAHLHDELRALRGLMENQLNVLGWDRMCKRHPQRVSVLSRLTEMDIGAELARKLAEDIGDDPDLERTWRTVLAKLAHQVPISDDDFMSRGGVVALVGATGVGKTTTVAKLAARFTMQHGQRDVALVTTDTYRIGAREQLLHFARIIGIPLYAADDQEELARVLARLCDKKLVLIDTAGMSQRDIRLTEQFVGLREVSPLLRSYLVMSANTQLAALDEVVRAFGSADLAGCIVTKLDEATSLGSALTVSIRHRLPIAYVGTGQRVPEDISPARAHRLISRAVPLAKRYGESGDDESMAVRFAGMGAHAER